MYYGPEASINIKSTDHHRSNPALSKHYSTIFLVLPSLFLIVFYSFTTMSDVKIEIKIFHSFNDIIL